MKNLFFKKFILAVVIFGLIFSPFNFFLEKQKTEARDVVIDPAHIVRTVLQTRGQEFTAKTRDWRIILRDIIVKRIIDMMVDQTISWIQGDGEPLFITDWGRFLGDATDIAVDSVIHELGLGFLCRPFDFQIRLALTRPQRFAQRIKCTLDDIVANIEDFYQDFEQGGWIAYHYSWRPENNFFGALITSLDEMHLRAAAEREKAKLEAEGGFKPVKDEAGRIITPGSTVGEKLAQALKLEGEWAANVQSWTVALTNAVINRLIKEGVRAMRRGDDPRGPVPGGDFDPRGILVDREIEREKGQMIARYDEFLNDRRSILDSKEKTLFAAETLLIVYQRLNKEQCKPLIPEHKIENLKKRIDGLKPQVDGLRKIVAEIETNIANIRAISPDNRYREWGLVLNQYQNFMSKYQHLLEEIITGSTRKAAREEYLDQQKELTMAETRLRICLIEQENQEE